MEPLKPEVKRLLTLNNPDACLEDVEEDERLLSERFTVDPNIPAARMASPAIRKLLTRLESVAPGPILDPAHIEGLLASCWEEFAGSHQEGMTSDKLSGRMEKLIWTPPVLSFEIERHGGTKLGSTRAENHRWEVNLETRIATCNRVGYRLVKPMQSRVNVEPIAVEIAELIFNTLQNIR